jgi:sugar (pentulose or hexulose) kinase
VLLLLCEWWQAMGFRGSLSAANHLPELNLRLPAGGGPGGGLHVTDASNASRTNLMDLRALAWHEPTLRLFGVSPDMLPDIRSNAEVYGTVAVEGPLQGVPISGCLGDQQAAMMGQRCAVHEAKNTYGTGGLPAAGSHSFCAFRTASPLHSTAHIWGVCRCSPV